MLEIDKTNRDTIVNSLERIAKNLILNKGIKVNDSVFSIFDVEIYYWHKLHRDDYANPNFHKRPTGEFEAHRYGIDLSLGNQEDEFGGILICGIVNIKSNESPIYKSSHVLNTLFNKLRIGQNVFEIIDYENPQQEVFKSARLKLGKASTDSKKEFVSALYKYLSYSEEIFKNYKGKESVIKNSDLELDKKSKLLGYILK